MTPGRLACGLALIAVLSVLGIFFFPASQGPYAAVHGPVTALLSIRAAARLRLIIVSSGLNAILGLVGKASIALVSFCAAVLSGGDSVVDRLPDCAGTILRC